MCKFNTKRIVFFSQIVNYYLNFGSINIMTFQKEISVGPFSRGFHLITEKIINELPIMTGLVNVFIKHTSASLTINENADPSRQ